MLKSSYCSKTTFFIWTFEYFCISRKVTCEDIQLLSPATVRVRIVWKIQASSNTSTVDLKLITTNTWIHNTKQKRRRRKFILHTTFIQTKGKSPFAAPLRTKASPMSKNLSALASNDIIESLASTLVASLAPDSYRDAMAVENGQLVSSSLSPMMTPAALPSGWRPPPPDFLLHTQFVCDRVLLPIVVCVGIIGNILSLVVLTRKEMTSPTNCFLTALAISDISLLFLQVPLFFGLNAATAGRDSYKLFVRYYTVIM